MKIAAISREHSDQRGIALITEPPLTADTFEEFKRRAEARNCTSLPVAFAAGHLIINPEQFTAELRAELDRLLSEADRVVSGAVVREQAEADKVDREITVESAAAGLGLPIV